MKLKYLLVIVVLFQYIFGNNVNSGVISWQYNLKNKKLYRKLYSQIAQKENALIYLNNLRQKAGMITLNKNSFLDTAALKHSKYINDTNEVGHYENYSSDYKTGYAPVNRAISAGYKSRFVLENLSKAQKDENSSIDDLFSAIYHRFGFLNTQIDEIGIGIDNQTYTYDMGNSYLNNLCSGTSFSGNGEYFYNVCSDEDFKIEKSKYEEANNTNQKNNPSIIIWPPQNATNIPPVFFEEHPDPLPNQSVSGYPISIEFNSYYFPTPPTIDSFTLEKEVNGSYENIDDIITLDKNSDQNNHLTKYQFAIFPKYRLDWNTKYRAKVIYEINGSSFTKEWEFKTKKLPNPYYIVTSNTTLTLKSNKKYSIYIVPQNVNDVLNGYSYQTNLSNDNIDIKFFDLNTLEVKIIGDVEQYVDLNLSNGINIKLVISDSDSAIIDDDKFEYNIQDGWNLFGAVNELNASDFIRAKIIWVYQDGKWFAFSNDPNTQEKIKNAQGIYELNGIIKRGQGFWIYK